MEPNKITCYKIKIRQTYNSCDKRATLKMNKMQQNESIPRLII